MRVFSRPTLKAFLLQCLLALLTLEFFSAGYFLGGFSLTHHRPAYAEAAHVFTVFQWRTEHDVWGAWHQPNGRVHHDAPCFHVSYASNSYGARDKERSLRSSEPRIVFLGDSFIEGFGVEAPERLTNRLELELGIEVLNFASGELGPLGYEILYENLGARFDHEHVVIGVMPENDFTDHHGPYWKERRTEAYRSRYRPYYGERDGEVFYPMSKPEGNVSFLSSYLKVAGPFRYALLRLTWFGGLLRELRYLIWARGFLLDERPEIEQFPRSYLAAKPRQIDHVLGSLRRIQKRAKGKRVTLFLIPRAEDYLTSDAVHRTSPVRTRLESFAAAQGIEFVDLRDEIPFDPKQFLECDGHWSAEGNRAAFEVLAPLLAAPSGEGMGAP